MAKTQEQTLRMIQSKVNTITDIIKSINDDLDSIQDEVLKELLNDRLIQLRTTKSHLAMGINLTLQGRL